MPYDRITELPDEVRGLLSRRAQLIYKEAFNRAWDHFTDEAEWIIEAGPEAPVNELAQEMAWKAVKRVSECCDDQ